ncbi:efflux RND transporter permease subunit [candidate division WOR-3 bacterium]|uniref:Efflux RND transporter permease subunit n=1 Tax=candidate division WOR-3 bacterium TaxID=2052148 RepID=A0A938BSV6_UNCW3|nr:efflux RND transporter permease subunit [candidate division WOR-3 bacterium]
MNRFFEFIQTQRVVAAAVLLGVIVWGAIAYRKLPTDAFPDVSPVMVPVFAEAHGMAPEEVERLITFPIESAMNGLPGVTRVKSTSAFGMAVIYVYFRDETDIYFARQIVAERLAGAMADLPEMHEPPALGPISTGLGEVFMYYLILDSTADTEGKSADTYLRDINDRIVKYQLQTVPGVTEILSMGGHVLQYQVALDPHALAKYEIGLADVVEAINANNGSAGGQFLVVGSEEYLVRGIGLIQTRDQLGDVQVKVVGGTPVYLRDVADVDYGREVRRGVVTRDGAEEVVAGIVMKLFGENTSDVIARLDRKVPAVQSSLPAGVRLIPYYNQQRLVNNATNTVKTSLVLGGILVIITLILFLGNLRAAIVVALSLPMCVLFAVIFMGAAGLSANLMSLGGVAIAIGMLGDAATVLVENAYRHMSEPSRRNASRLKLITQASAEVARPILFSVAIIAIVFLPLFSLQGVEGKMFSPMAYTILFALAGSLIFAFVFSPMLSSFLLRGRAGGDFFLVRWLKQAYQPLLEQTVRRPVRVAIAAGIALALSIFAATRLGTEFIPVLEEGVVQVNVTMAPSISLEKATATVQQVERVLLSEYGQAIQQTIAKIGRPEAGSHPHPVNSAHIQMELKPERGWRRRWASKEALVNDMSRLLGEFPGIQVGFTQPIQNMFDELLSGVKTQLAVKLFGDDLDTLRLKAEEIQAVVKGVPGLVDLAAEQSYGQPQVQVVADREACSRHGVSVADILEAVELGVGGEVVDHIYLNTRRYGINVRLQEEYRRDAEAIGNLLVSSRDGKLVPLGQVADVRSTVGPIQVNREDNQRCWTIAANVRGRDIGSVVADMRRQVEAKVKLPPGYWLKYGGQFENQQRAMGRLAFIVPTALVLIFLMLFLSLGSIRQAALIFANVPLALIGGVLGLLVFGEYLSVPAAIGFIALFGIAVQNALVLVTCINQLREEGTETRTAIIQAGLLRLRPVLMTAITTVLGLVPLLMSTGMGSEVQRPLAVVVVFGLVTSTILTLILIPAMYPWLAPRFVQEDRRSETQILSGGRS